MPDLSVIIAASRKESLSRCLNALSKQEMAKKMEVLVVLSKGMDSPIPPEGLDVHFIKATCNHPSDMRNKAAAIARSPLLAFLDDDVVPFSAWGRALLKLADPKARDILVGPNRDERWPLKYRIAQALQENPLFEGLISHGYRKSEPRMVTPHDAPLCNLIVPRPLFLELGGLNSSIPYYFDDVDFNQRAQAKGVRYLMYSELSVQHDLRPLIRPYLSYKFKTRYMIGRHFRIASHLYKDSYQLKLVHVSWVLFPLIVGAMVLNSSFALLMVFLYAIPAILSFGHRLKEPAVMFFGPPLLLSTHIAVWTGYTLGRVVGMIFASRP